MLRKFTAVLTAALMLCTLSVCADSINISEYINNEVFVLYTNGDTEVLTFDGVDELIAGISELTANDNVSVVQPNYSYTASALTNDALSSQQWALYNDGSFVMEEEKNSFPVYDTPFGEAIMPGQWHVPDFFGTPGGTFRRYNNTYYGNRTVTAQAGIDINMQNAWNTYSDSGKEIIVALVDTGTDYTHEELAERIWTNTGEIAGNGIDDDGNGYIDDVNGWNFYNNSNEVYKGSEDDHGTHGAGTIAAKANNGTGIAGINQSENVKVMSVKALGGQSGSGSTASVIRAIQYAEANGAVICNLSLGTQNNDAALRQTIENSNMLFVVAAGNEGSSNDSTPTYPASYDLENVISVANLNYDGNLNYTSNYGSTVEIAAPGSYILSTTAGGGYSYMTGTSMSAPFVSGAAALVYSHFGDKITLAGVKEILLSSASVTENLSGAVAAGRMLDLGAALSFDINSLSDTAWETKTPPAYKGSAPVIKAYISQVGWNSCLVAQVYDEDYDVVGVSYAEGMQDASYFSGGGTKLRLKENGTYTFKAAEGTYTFYAVDSAGNETVYSVTVSSYRETAYEQPRINRFPFFQNMMPFFW